MSSEFFVYLLHLEGADETSSGKDCTYVGATVDLDHRLRQHNRELSGGAHATSAKVLKGQKWERVCHVRNFPSWQAALQFEWRWKQISRKLSPSLRPLERRMLALKQLLELDRSTSKAIPYKEWEKPPQVYQEIESGLFLILGENVV